MDDEFEREEEDVVVLGVLSLDLIELSVSEVRTHMSYHEHWSFAEVASGLTGFEFRVAFHMHLEVFFALVALVRKDIEPYSNQASRGGGSIEDAVCVAVILRILSGATYIDMMILFG